MQSQWLIKNRIQLIGGNNPNGLVSNIKIDKITDLKKNELLDKKENNVKKNNQDEKSISLMKLKNEIDNNDIERSVMVNSIIKSTKSTKSKNSMDVNEIWKKYNPDGRKLKIAEVFSIGTFSGFLSKIFKADVSNDYKGDDVSFGGDGIGERSEGRKNNGDSNNYNDIQSGIEVINGTINHHKNHIRSLSIINLSGPHPISYSSPSDCVTIEYGSKDIVDKVIQDFIDKKHCYYTGCPYSNDNIDHLPWLKTDLYCDPIIFSDSIDRSIYTPNTRNTSNTESISNTEKSTNTEFSTNTKNLTYFSYDHVQELRQPFTHLNFPVLLDNESLYGCASERSVFMYKNRTLRKFPNQSTFMNMNKDFKNVKRLDPRQCKGIPRGSPLEIL